MTKIHILYYDFKSTSGNHAGMAYLARYLRENISEVKLYRHFPQEFRGGRYLGYILSWLLTFKLFFNLKKNDKVLFLEFLTKDIGYQDSIAKRLRYLKPKVKFLAMVHLAKNHLLDLYKTEENLKRRLSSIDSIVVLGSSLERFFYEVGIRQGVIRTFHYVDVDFYKPKLENRPESSNLQVIFVGSIKRNFSQLEEIVRNSASSIRFHICLGRDHRELEISNYNNVKLYDYLEECELLHLMQLCDVNLSVLEDTVGSNAITTSLAVGLVQVVSDVGSIRDYCTDKNSLFCKDPDQFTEALHFLNDNPNVLKEMKIQARYRALDLSMSNFLDEFNSFT